LKSLEPSFLDKLSFTHDQMASLRAIGEYQGKQRLYYEQSPEILQNLQRVAEIESTESSNRIEGITAPRERIEALVLKKTTPQNRSEQEVEGYRSALELIHESHEHMDFTTNVILQLHSMIYRYQADPGGKWKSNDNEIRETHPDGSVRIRFKPTSAVLTPSWMEKLCENYKETVHTKSWDPLIVIPLAILDFLCVHPFKDGNGRMSRLLTLLELYHFDYQVGRYISLERIFEESKEGYYETLEASSKNWHQGKHDPHPWLNYFWGVMIRAYREFEQRVGTIHPGKGSKTDEIMQVVSEKVGPFAISEIEMVLPEISRDMIKIVLRQMKEDGKLSIIGKGRGAKWIRK
jgi:Fic family protein